MYTRKIAIPERDTFSPLKTFDCGQCFRFEEKGDFVEGVVGSSLIRVPKTEVTGEIEYFISDDTNRDLFFDPDHSYEEMCDDFVKPLRRSGVLDVERCLESGRGIRILKQDFFETLISFIISQNNNIPRIKKNINSICSRFGESFEVNGEVYYSFPTPEALLWAGDAGLNECRLGFRTKYILDAAKKVASGEVAELALGTLATPSLDEKLQTIKGVGAKVSACVMLFGLGRLDTVPVDVWMKKVFDKYFGQRTDLGVYGGVAQQYLFYHERFVVGKE
ncbi:MAG: DNA-3-methyladenine glycosylase 2 family protein [Clostridia bacterium]|nr:DNA-3-methyladenine glycosylase 2 family protein [Clostridia bacterium]